MRCGLISASTGLLGAVVEVVWVVVRVVVMHLLHRLGIRLGSGRR